LRSIEDELLKQLSLEGTPGAQENAKPSLPDVKHVSARTGSAAPQAAEPTPVEPSIAPVETAIPKSPKPKIVEATGRDIPAAEEPTSSTRTPQHSIVVPIAVKSAPHRTPKIKNRERNESLSVKDLEHRLAITESQITLLTQELESTRAKLARSKSQVDELTRQIEDGGSSVRSPASQDSAVMQSDVGIYDSDSTTSTNTRAARYGTTARITKDNTPIRIGPGSQESTITRLSRNSIISIERRTGGWYRIVTSDGTRGWISGAFLIFDEGNFPGSTVRIGAYQPRLETMKIEY
jgi:uncharacterized coiled-coil protein SlyX